MAVARAFSLAAYRALSRRTPPPPAPTYPPRGADELVWLHVGNMDDLTALTGLCERLQSYRPGVTILFTLPQDADLPGGADVLPPDCAQVPVPDEHPASVAAFLDHWQPDLALWVWGGLRPNLIDMTHARGIPLHLISADLAGLDGRRESWLPDLGRHLAGCFASASARSASAARALARLGLAPKRITVMPPLQPAGQVPGCAERDLADLTDCLQSRPVWYAADLARGEWREMIDAHLIALRSAHRLLLVLHVHHPDELPGIAAFLETYGLSFAIWSDGDAPRESTQILLTDLPDEAGLWHRIAAVTFLGGSLAEGSAGRDPLPAAQLGSAVVHGPYVSAFQASYARLSEAGAARKVRDAAGLGSAVAELIVPAKTAAMAHAGWNVVTEGAELVDSVIDLVQDSLDRARQASP